jgi:NDP-sugar pyrophosphorylase family protein
MGVDVPKCMLEVGGKKLIDICIESLTKDGFRDFVFLLGHKHEMVTDHVGDGRRYGITVQYSIDPESTLGWGKGKAFKFAVINNKINRSRRSIVVFPDDIILIPNVYSKYVNHHLEYVSKYDISASAMLVPGTEYPYGVAKIEDNTGLIQGFIEKPVVDKPTSVGIYILEPAAYGIVIEKIAMEDLAPVELEHTVLPALAEKSKLGSFFIPNNSWLPINTMKEYERAVKIMAVQR